MRNFLTSGNDLKDFYLVAILEHCFIEFVFEKRFGIDLNDNRIRMKVERLQEVRNRNRAGDCVWLPVKHNGSIHGRIHDALA